MQSLNVHLTIKSKNEKTGPIPVSTTSFEACPNTCPLKKNGCYANGGPLAIFWKKVTDGKLGKAWDSFCDDVKALPDGILWRHNQAGDLIGDKESIDESALVKLIHANKGKRGFTYTHYDTIKSAWNRALVKKANKNGFTINLSANDLSHADKLKATKAGPVVTLLPSTVQGKQSLTTPEGNRVVVCPATYNDSINCKSCGLCALQRDVIVGFPSHGAQKRKADSIATK